MPEEGVQVGDSSEDFDGSSVVVEGEAATAPEDEAPAEGGQAEAEGTPELFNVDEYADQMVSITVDGEEITVPLREVRDGYMRQADYTRKTQQLSMMRTLEQALKVNPKETLAYLQSIYIGDNQAAPSAEEAEDGGDDWESQDPALRKLTEFEQRFAAFEEWQQEQLLDQTLSGLQGKYGDDFNEQEVLQAAVSRGISDPAQLEQVFRDIQFDKFYAAAKARSDHAEADAKDDQARQAAAAQVAQMVTSGEGVAPSSVTSPVASPSTFDEAFNAAWAAAGLD